MKMVDNLELIEKFGIKNYTINVDISIDVDGDVDLRHRELKEIPFNFRIVTGYFHCGYNNLVSLKVHSKYPPTSLGHPFKLVNLLCEI